MFEWLAPTDDGQNTVCAGGRYDELVTLLGGKPTAAAGFALGVERLALLLEGQLDEAVQKADIYMVAVGDKAEHRSHLLADELRVQLPVSVVLINNCDGGSFKSQLRRADKSGATIALILGEQEVQTGSVTIKDLRGESVQIKCRESELLSHIQTYLSP